MRRDVLSLILFLALFGMMIAPSPDMRVPEATPIQIADGDSFSVSGIGDNTESFVQQLSNLHAPTDIGTHSVFADLQDYGVNYDQMTEGNTGTSGFNLEDYVDQQSNLHAPTDVGTHSNFAEMQDTDSVYDTLTEGDTGSPEIAEDLYVDTAPTPVTWTQTGTSPYLDAQDYPTSYISTASNGAVSGWYGFGATTGSSGTFTVVLYVYCGQADDDDIAWELDWTSDGTADASGSFTDPAGAWYNTGTVSGLDTVAEIDACRVRFTMTKGGGAPTTNWVDAAYLDVYQAGTTNYDLDLEVGWTAADFDESNEELCIYGGTQGTEALRVDVWDGSQWQNVIADVAAGWNNVSVSSYLTGTALEIRFTDTSDESTAQETWEIEGVLLHVWTAGSDNYELDLEVGWTSADYDETNEELCIYPVTGGGWPAEDIKVDVWNGAWTNVISDLAPDQWNNVSITSYLTGSSFEIRFVGGTETGDTTQNTWEIDAVLIHVWTPSYAPASDQAPTLDNPTDTDNMYAQYVEYQVTAYVSDQNGFADIDYLEVSIWDNAQSTEYCRFRYDEDTNSFTEEYDAGTYVALNTGSSTATESGNDIDATFYFTIDWDFPDSTDLDARVYVVDTQTESSTTWYEVNWDTETRLDYSVAPSISDGSGTLDRGDLDGSFTITGTIIYYGSGDDFPDSASVDVWVSAPEYGTSVGPWSDLTLTSGQFSVTCYADDVVGEDTYTVTVVEEGAGSGGTDLYYTTSTTDTYIADQVQIQSYSVVDARVDINANVNVDVTLYYDYDDSPVTDGTVTINSAAATHQGSGVWRITESESTVMANTYDTVAYSGGTHGISLVDQNGQSQQVIWDQVLVVSYSVADDRVNVGNSVNVDVTLIYDYDDAPVTDGTVTINTISAAHQGSGVWRISPSQASVTAVTYNLVAASGNTHGITSVNQNSQSQEVIWDQVLVTGYTVADARVNIDDSVNVDVTVEYAYDSASVTDGSLTINGFSAAHQGLGVWRIVQSQSTVQSVTYDTVACSGNTEGITSVDQNGQSQQVVWDQVLVDSYSVSDARANVDANVNVDVTVEYAYDGTPVTDGSLTINGFSATHQGLGVWRVVQTRGTVQSVTYNTVACSGNTEGITSVDQNGQLTSVIWDRIVVQTTLVDDGRVDVSASAEIRVTLILEYDSTPLGAGDSVTLDGVAMTWDGTNSWFDLTRSQASVGVWLYYVNSTTEATYGITALNLNSQSVSVIWDQIQVQSYSTTDNRVGLNVNVDVSVTLLYVYDSTPVTDGSVTINSLSATHVGSGVWQTTDSQSSVQLVTYDTVACSGNTFGITAVDQNSQSTDVIWDRVQVQSYTVLDNRVNVGDSVNVDVTLYYDYDNSPVTDGSVTINTISAVHQGSGVWRISDSESSVIANTYDTVACSGNSLGITAVDQNGQTQQVIWDRVQVQGYSVVDDRVNVNVAVNIEVMLYYDYDDSPVTNGVVTINGEAANHLGSGVWWIQDSQAAVQLVTYDTVACSANTYGISVVDQNSLSQDVIWDQVVVVSYSVSDTRTSINDNVDVNVTLIYDYDDAAVTDGSVLINGNSATHLQSGIWNITATRGSVQLVTFNLVSCSGNLHGISAVDQNSQSVDVIFDRVQVVGYAVADARVNIGASVDVNVTLIYDYDDNPITDGTVTVNGLTATHISGGVWQFSDTEASVWANTYSTVAASGNLHGIDSVDQNGQSQQVVWDEIAVRSYSATDARVNINDAATIEVTLEYEYDDAPVTDGSVTINGISASHQGSGVWRITDTESAVTMNTYNLVVCSGNTLGITSVNQNSQTQEVIWDRVQVQGYSVSDSRVSINDAVNIDVTLYYDYDDSPVTDGTVTVNGISATHIGLGVWRASDSESTVTGNLYNTVSAAGNTYGISSIDQNGQSVSVIWDQLVITIGVDNPSPTNGVQANFTLAVIFDYDDAACTTYQVVVYRNGTWWHSFTDSNKSGFVDTNSDMTYTYTVAIVTSEGTFSVTAFTSNSRQVTWSIAANIAPVNDAEPVLINADDTDNLYARYRYYIITSNVSDADGYADIEYVEFSMYDNARTFAFWTVRYTVAGGTFSIQAGASYIALGSCSAVMVGNDLDITWAIKVDWDHPDLVDVDMHQYVNDGTVGVEDYYESNWDVETRLEITGLTVDDGSGTAGRGPLDGSFVVSGTVIYYGSGDDFPLSNETDVWVSSDAYGTNVGPWSDLTLSSGQFSLTAYAANSVILANLTIKAVAESAGSGGTSLLESATQSSYISDRVQVQVYTAVDPRINIGDTATIDVELLYEYDSSPVTDGTVTVNTLSATHQGGGVWRFTDMKSSVQLVTYDTVAYSGGTHGLSQVDQSAMSQDVIWDQIVVQTTVASDTRTNVGDSVEIRVTLWLAYDSSFLGSGDSVSLNGTSMTWDFGNSWFELAVSLSDVGLQAFYVNSSSEATYGITSLDVNSMSASVIWDQIVVQTTAVTDGRVDVTTSTEIRVTLWLAYDHEYLGAGDTVTLEDSAMSWDGANSWWEYSALQSSVGLWRYFVNSSIESTYGITALDMNGIFVEVIWDQIVVQTTAADDYRVNVGDNAEIRVTLYLAYDSTLLGAADSVALDGSLMTYDAGNSWFELLVSQASVGSWLYFVNATADSTYGITALDLNSQNVAVVWDRLVVQTTVADDSRIDISTSAEVRVTVWHEYDGTFLGSADSVTLDGSAMTWDAGNSWFELQVSQLSVGAWAYFVNSSISTVHGITLLDLNGQSVAIVWDQIQVQSSSVSDGRVNIGDTVDLDVTLVSLYDSSPVTTGSVLINGEAASHQGGGLWRISVSNASVSSALFNAVSASGNTYGISAIDQNAFSQTIIWDRLIISVGVDDPSLVNGVQANFTLTVTFDYDDSVCSTYQVVVIRNSTWWHSFTDTNLSLFVDVGTDVAYEYTVSIITSETAYGITAFTVNTRLAVWSAAPNEVPINTATPVLTNADDTDYMYARYRYYVLTSNVSDANGYLSISYVELTLLADDNSTVIWILRYTRATGVFSVELGGSFLTISASSYASGTGDVLEIVWMIKIDWTHPDVSGCYVEQLVTDGIDSDADSYSLGWNVETRLDYSATPSLSDDRGDVNTTDLVAQGSVIYYGSSITPLANETDVWIVHDVSGTWMGNLVAGDFTVGSISSSLVVRLNTYTFKIVIEGAGSGSSDLFFGASVTDTFITDRVEVYQAGTVDSRVNVNTVGEVWWRARYVYDSSEITSGVTIEINGSLVLTWDSVEARWHWSGSRASVQQDFFDIVSVLESTYGISNYTVLTSTQSVIWDAVVVSITNPADQRIDVGLNATGILVSAVYAFDGAPFDGTVTLNNTDFQYSSPQRQGYVASSLSGDYHGITLIQSSDVTWVIWDRVHVVSISATLFYFDPDESGTVAVTLQYEYDGTWVLAGSFSIAGEALAHVGTGRWEASISRSSYQSLMLDDLTTCDATLHGITEYNMDGQSVTFYWDRLEFYAVSVSDAHVNIGDTISLNWSVRLENAGIPVAAGIVSQMTGGISLLPSTGFLIASHSESTVTSSSFGIISASLENIDNFVQTVSDVTVIWDRVRVETTTASTDSLNAGQSVEIRVTMVYEFDETAVTDGEVRLTDGSMVHSMTYNAAGYWTASVVKSVAGSYTFRVDSIWDNEHGIQVLNLNAQSVVVEFAPGGSVGLPIETIALTAVVGVVAIGGIVVVARRRKPSVPGGLDFDVEPEGLGAAEPEVSLEEDMVGVDEAEDIEEAITPEIEEETGLDEVDEVVSEPEAAESEAALLEDTELAAEPEIPTEDLAAEPVEEVVEEPVIEPEVEVVEEELPSADAEPEAEEVTVVEAETAEIDEVEVEPTPERPLTKKELLDSMPPEIREAIPEADLQKLSKKEIEGLIESYVPPEEPLPDVGGPLPTEPSVPLTTELPLSELSKNELMDLLPDDIKSTVSAKELKRLSKQELISLLESFIGPEGES